MKTSLSVDQISELLRRPTLTVVEAGRVLGLSRNGAYDAIARDEIEHLKFSKRIVVPTAPLRKKLGMEA